MYNSGVSRSRVPAQTSRLHRPLRIKCNPSDSTDISNEVLQSVDEHFKRPLVMEAEQFDIFGKNVAMKLRGLSKQQSLIVEKIITDSLGISNRNGQLEDAT